MVTQSRLSFLFLFLCFLLLVSFNIYSSQNHPALLFSYLSNPNPLYAQALLNDVKGTPEYVNQKDYLYGLYGPWFTSQIENGEMKKNEEIGRLMTLLNKNPNARDVLGTIAVLYWEDRSISLAKSYYEKAQQIDPSYTIPELEALNLP